MGAVDALLCVPLELVLSAAMLVVTVVLLETLSIAAEPEEEPEIVEEGLWVINVVFSVVVLPRESVVVYVLIATGRLVVVVYVDPTLSVLVITTGTRPVNPLETVDTEVTVDGGPEIVVVLHSVTGYTTAITEPPSVVVIVVVVTDPALIVTVAAAPPVAEAPPSVTVVVTCAARLEAWFSAFRRADAGIGAPAISHAHCRGVRSKLLSRSLSHCPCMQVIKSGRKLPAEARQRHATSVISQLSS